MEKHSADLSTGICFSWGSSADGKLGCIDVEKEKKHNVVYPKPNHYFWPLKEGGSQVVQVACGYMHTLYLLKCGRVMASGSNKNGQCGVENAPREDRQDFNSYSSPIKVKGFEEGLDHRLKIHQISAGFATSYALTETGDIYSWGQGKFGALGRCSTIGDQTSDDYRPVIITSLVGTRVTALSSGHQHCACITSENRCFTWGRNSDGQAGSNTDNRAVETPTEILVGLRVRAVDCGVSHTLALVECESQNDAKIRTVLYGWGNPSFYDPDSIIEPQIHGVPREITSVTNVMEEAYIEPIDVKAGGNFSLILDAKGNVYSWGSGTYGELGSGRVWDEAFPKVIEGLRDVEQVSVGSRHCCVIKRKKNQAQKELWSWGYNSHGELGHGDFNLRLQPHKINALDGFELVSVAVGHNHSVCIAQKMQKSNSEGNNSQNGLEKIDTEKTNRQLSSYGTNIGFGEEPEMKYCFDTLIGHPNESKIVHLRGSYEATYKCFHCNLSRICMACARKCHKKHAVRVYLNKRDQSHRCLCCSTEYCDVRWSVIRDEYEKLATKGGDLMLSLDRLGDLLEALKPDIESRRGGMKYTKKMEETALKAAIEIFSEENEGCNDSDTTRAVNFRDFENWYLCHFNIDESSDDE